MIIKSDGTPSYNFAAVVDDLDMGITHVVRGEEHHPNTARQVLLYRALDADEPEFSTSASLGPDGRTQQAPRRRASPTTGGRATCRKRC